MGPGKETNLRKHKGPMLVYVLAQPSLQVQDGSLLCPNETPNSFTF